MEIGIYILQKHPLFGAIFGVFLCSKGEIICYMSRCIILWIKPRLFACFQKMKKRLAWRVVISLAYGTWVLLQIHYGMQLWKARISKKKTNPNDSPIGKMFGFVESGAPWGTRPPNHRIRSALLYPIELMALIRTLLLYKKCVFLSNRA